MAGTSQDHSRSGAASRAARNVEGSSLMRTTVFAVACLFAMAAPSAYALEASKTVEIAAPPAKVWATIGDFCGIAQWHPAVETCTPSVRGKRHIRTLALKGGGTIVERLVSRHEKAMDYTYAIVASPFPVSGYRSTIKVSPTATGSLVSWTGSFKAKGADDATATSTIQSVYDSGLAALADKAK
jgi:uncharacterized protein YndB with AHSA1/START domain